MAIINYAAGKQLLVIARGHPYERDTLADTFDGFVDYSWSLVEQPAALHLIGADLTEEYSAVVFYDMPGVDFTAEIPGSAVEPDAATKHRYRDLFDSGIGLVFVHHAIASWPAWDEYAEVVGGRFHYREASLRGAHFPDSGYRHEVRHTLSVSGDHPVTAGLPSSFTMEDELYLCPVFEEDVEPLLRSDFQFIDGNFYSATCAIEGEMFSREGWSHPRGSNIVAWAKHVGDSPVVYIQGGDGPSAWNDENFRRLLSNAVDWVGSSSAREWVRERKSNATNQQ